MPPRPAALTHLARPGRLWRRSQVRFEAAAARARCLLEAADAAPLLAEHSLYVHLPEKARKTMGANVAALKRVAAVLGAKVRA